jgi:hypothetical protein
MLEGAMHIHPAAVGLNSNNTYGLANERAASSQRAAEVRKKLLKAGQTDDGGQHGSQCHDADRSVA